MDEKELLTEQMIALNSPDRLYKLAQKYALELCDKKNFVVLFENGAIARLEPGECDGQKDKAIEAAVRKLAAEPDGAYGVMEVGTRGPNIVFCLFSSVNGVMNRIFTHVELTPEADRAGVDPADLARLCRLRDRAEQRVVATASRGKVFRHNTRAEQAEK